MVLSCIPAEAKWHEILDQIHLGPKPKKISQDCIGDASLYSEH